LTRVGYSGATPDRDTVHLSATEKHTDVATARPQRRSCPAVALTDDITDPRLAKALAHPLRLEILRHLGDRTASPSEIAAEIGAPLTNVSYHVRKLRSLGVIKLVRKAPKRGVVEHYYSANQRQQVSDEAWAQTPAIVKEALIAPLAERGAEMMVRASRSAGFDRRESHFSASRMNLDEPGWKAAAKVLEQALEQVREIEQEASERLESGKTEPLSTALVLSLFETTAAEAAAPKPARRRSRARATA
jgi:DNA-binding transcriptional ArsR family regulator